MNAAAIRSGAHLGWLTWVARVYFGLFSDLDQVASPHERLVKVLGEANASTAIEGFIAVLRGRTYPRLRPWRHCRANIDTTSGGVRSSLGLMKMETSPGLDGRVG